MEISSFVHVQKYWKIQNYILDGNNLLVFHSMGHLREASTLILASKGQFVQNIKTSIKDGTHILTIKRSDTSTHFASAYAFPGGNVDKADKSLKWINIFPECEMDVHLNIVDIYGKKQDEVFEKDAICKAVSFRICAIREMFEECGILLCNEQKSTSTVGKNVSYVTSLEIEKKQEWREKISNNAEEFLNLCIMNGCYPNIKPLHLWSNWCTPTNLKRRYNSLFFIAILGNAALAEPDYKEVQQVKWELTDIILEEDNNEIIFLPPPQFYELNRLKKFSDIGSLCKFIKDRYKRLDSCQQYMPVHGNTKDGLVALLPGDEKYQQLLHNMPSVGNLLEIDEDLKTLRCRKMHRMEFRDDKKCIIVENYVSPFNHVLPDTTPTCIPNVKSKL